MEQIKNILLKMLEKKCSPLTATHKRIFVKNYEFGAINLTKENLLELCKEVQKEQKWDILDYLAELFSREDLTTIRKAFKKFAIK